MRGHPTWTFCFFNTSKHYSIKLWGKNTPIPHFLNFVVVLRKRIRNFFLKYLFYRCQVKAQYWRGACVSVTCFAIIVQTLNTIKTFIQIDFNHKFRFHDTFSCIGNFKNVSFKNIWNCVEKLRAVLIYSLNREYDLVNVLVHGLVSFRVINS